MKRNLIQSITFMLLLAMVGFFSAPAPAKARTAPLVSTEWLAEHVGAKDLVVVDVRTETNYGVGHIPGAVNMPYVGWEPFNEKKQCQLMPTPADFTKMMRAAGLNDSSHVIIYDHGNSIGDATKGAATVWIMEAMGHGPSR